MTTNDPTYTELLSLRDRLEERFSRLQRDLEDVRKKLDSVSVTLALLDETAEPAIEPSLPSGRSGPLDIESLRGVTQIEALKKIALHGGGRFKTSVAKPIMLRAGLIKNPKNANNILFSVIQRSELFERVEPGVYRLKASQKPERPEKMAEANF